MRPLGLSINWLSRESELPTLTLVREAFEPTNEVILFLHLVKEQTMALVLRRSVTLCHQPDS